MADYSGGQSGSAFGPRALEGPAWAQEGPTWAQEGPQEPSAIRGPAGPSWGPPKYSHLSTSSELNPPLNTLPSIQLIHSNSVLSFFLPSFPCLVCMYDRHFMRFRSRHRTEFPIVSIARQPGIRRNRGRKRRQTFDGRTERCIDRYIRHAHPTGSDQ